MSPHRMLDTNKTTRQDAKTARPRVTTNSKALAKTSYPLSIGESRYCRPHRHGEWGVEDDLFALGSVLYELATGIMPYRDESDDEVTRLYREGSFPTVEHLLIGEIITRCWAGAYRDASEVCKDIVRLLLHMRDRI